MILSKQKGWKATAYWRTESYSVACETVQIVCYKNQSCSTGVSIILRRRLSKNALIKLKPRHRHRIHLSIGLQNRHGLSWERQPFSERKTALRWCPGSAAYGRMIALLSKMDNHTYFYFCRQRQRNFSWLYAAADSSWFLKLKCACAADSLGLFSSAALFHPTCLRWRRARECVGILRERKAAITM